jgi:hypothetical protein
MPKKYSRKQLLQALADCQGLFGELRNVVQNDRSPNRNAQAVGLCDSGFEFCLKVLSTEDPVEGTLLGKVDRRDFV